MQFGTRDCSRIQSNPIDFEKKIELKTSNVDHFQTVCIVVKLNNTLNSIKFSDIDYACDSVPTLHADDDSDVTLSSQENVTFVSRDTAGSR